MHQLQSRLRINIRAAPAEPKRFTLWGRQEVSGQGHTRAAGLLTSFRLSLLSWVTLRFDI